MKTKHYRQSEINFLKKYYPTHGKKFCMKKLNRTEPSIRGKVHELKIKQNKNSKFFKNWQAKAAKSKIGKKRPEHSLFMKEYSKKYNFGYWTKTHGLSATKAYVIWNTMMARCYNKKTKSYKYYGARGIKVCKDWHDVRKFNIWFNKKYSNDLQIERIDVNKDYSPSNCTFTDIIWQARNRRSNVLNESKVRLINRLTREGVNQTEIGKRLGISNKTIHCVVKKQTWKEII